jgi:putative ABC transport system substrate-binding protein
MVGNFDTVALGFVASLGRPGGNVSGVLTAADGSLAGKKLALLTQVVPHARRIALLVSEDPSLLSQVQATQQAAGVLGVELHVLRAQAHDYGAAFATMRAERCGAVLVAAAPFSLRDRQPVIELAAKHQLPAIWEWPEQVDDGGLMSYGASLNGLIQRQGELLSRIFKGAKPADLPVEQASSVELVIHLKTARALGLTIPPALLLRADRVVR